MQEPRRPKLYYPIDVPKSVPKPPTSTDEKQPANHHKDPNDLSESLLVGATKPRGEPHRSDLVEIDLEDSKPLIAAGNCCVETAETWCCFFGEPSCDKNIAKDILQCFGNIMCCLVPIVPIGCCVSDLFCDSDKPQNQPQSPKR